MSGRGYRAEQDKDGTWTIFDVPIFGAHEDDGLKVDSAWLYRALSKARTRAAEDYFGPVHVFHHETEKEVSGAGKFRLTRVAKIMHGGEEIMAMFADLFGVSQRVYDRVRAGDLSYRSVELLPPEFDEIDSLALLDDEVPYFRFPLMRIASEKPLIRQANTTRGPVVAYSAGSKTRIYLSHFEEKNKMEDPNKEDDETKADEEKDAEKKMADEAPPAWVSQLMSVLGQIAEAVGIGSEEEAPAEMSRSAKAVGIDAKSAGQMAAMTDQLKSFKAEIANLKTQSRISEEVAKLEKSGYGKDMIRSFTKRAKTNGINDALSFAAGAAVAGPCDPPTRFNELPAPAPDSDAVRAYAAKGPLALEKARELSASHKRLGSSVPLADFIRINMDPDQAFSASMGA